MTRKPKRIVKDKRSSSLPRIITSEKRRFSERGSPEPIIQSKKSAMASLSKEDQARLEAKGMPPWGKDFFDMLNNGLSVNLTKAITESVQETIRSELKVEIQSLETKLLDIVETKCEQIKEACAKDFDSVSSKVDLVQLQVEGMQTLVRKVDTRSRDRLVKVEEYQRRNNLLFSGFKEVKNETNKDCLKKVKEQLAKAPKGEDGRDLTKAIIERCHRVGEFKPRSKRPRDIIVRFLDVNDRQLASDSRSSYDEGIYVKGDHTVEINNAQRQLKPILKVIKDTPYAQKGRVKVIDGFVVVDGKRYNSRQLHTLPDGINFYLNNHVSTDELIAFFGSLSPFSNFFWSPMRIDGDDYVNGEQYISGQLARTFDREDLFLEIMHTTDPYVMKQIAYQVKQLPEYNAEKWHEKCPDVAMETCSAKFKQNLYFKNFLLDTGDKLITEATKEAPWGCGLLLSDPDIKVRDKWKRVGVMGDALMRVREELKADRAQFAQPFNFTGRDSRSRSRSSSPDMDTQ